MNRSPPPPTTRLGGVLRFLAAGLVSALLVTGTHQICWKVFVSPAPPDVVVPAPEAIISDGDRTVSGDSFLERRGGLWIMGHKGSSPEIGVAHGLLGAELNQRAERIMFAEMERWVPFPPFQALMSKVSQWQYRHSMDHLPDWFRQEMWGAAAHLDDPFAWKMATYPRLIYYHLLHDITQEIPGDSPLLACTAWAASAPATQDGHLLLARNFDFEIFEIFDKEKVVHIFARDGVIPFASVSWMGLSGVVTGLNAEGIWISVNAARSTGRNRSGMPVLLLARNVLEQAATLDEAVRMLSEETTLVSDIYLLGDGKTGQALVVERGVVDGRVGVRNSRADGTIAAANHMLTEPFAGDRRDLSIREGTGTLQRHTRAAELLAKHRPGEVTVRTMLQIARDRSAPGDQALAPGNRNAVDALIATHSVLADASARVMWVSEWPHTLGRYQRIDLLDELDAMGVDTSAYRASAASSEDLPGTLPADPFVAQGWPALQDQRDRVRAGRKLLRKSPDAALQAADQVLSEQALNTEALLLRARALERLKRADDALAAYKRFVDAQPQRGRALEEARSKLGLPPLSALDQSELPRHEAPD